ncbi:hypothetical protein [Mesorhizobium sp. WSM2239]|uniref:Helix-turn-helix domain-containing protein n=2 Tax=unclassified Mesorhizobium TaxID=325217 RepID=A0AAU8D0W7_9HYPH
MNVPSNIDLLLLDRLIAEMQDLRVKITGHEPADPFERPIEKADDLVDTAVASERLNVPQDTLRSWCRTRRIGLKRGGRWLVSMARARRIASRFNRV